MFDLEKNYGYDKDYANAGAKKMLGTDPEEYIMLRFVPNPEWRAGLDKANRLSADVLASADAQTRDDVAERMLAKLQAQASATGWGKKFGVGGKVLEFSPEVCEELFIKYPKFRADCYAFASDHRNYKMVPDVTVEKIKK